MTAEDLETFVAMDDNLDIAGDPSNEELLEAVAQGSRGEQSEESEDDADIHQNLTIPMKMKMVQDLHQFIQKNSMFNALSLFHQVEDKVFEQVTANKKQTSLDSFFSLSKK